MSEFETPFFRDLSKILMPMIIGIGIGIFVLLMWYPLYGEILFNIEGMESGFNIILDRDGTCFIQEDHQMCSSGAWIISGVWIFIWITCALVTAIITLKLPNKESAK